MARELLNLGFCLSFQIQKTDYDVGHLHAGIVDVVLHVHFAPGESQQANKRIAKDGVTQMTYMCRLVGIDTRVLDQNFADRPVPRGCSSAASATAKAARFTRALI